MELVVPPDDDKPLPTLGDQVCDFLEERAVYGPGDLKGQRVQLSEDWRYCLYRLYEHWPRGHPRAGRRRFKKGRLSVRKGAAKTELMAFVGFLEIHPEAPVRFNGFNRDGSLKQGRPVVDPFVPMLANAKLQVSELAFGALKYICEECDDADLFDATLDRIIRLDDRGRADGKALPLANAPDTNDGGRTTCNLYDETHRLYLPSEKAAIVTMEANLGKRTAQDPWSLGVTTAGEPGQQSQAEDDHFEAEAIARGEIKRPRMFYFHRQASDGWDMDVFEERCEAIREASGDELAARTDVEDLASQWDVPKADVAYLERVWCNRWTQQGLQAFNLRRWKDLRRPGAVIPRRAMVTIGFDGARMRDSTAMVVTDVRTGLQVLAGLWERPHDADEDWEVDESEVNAKRAELFRTYRVVKMYADPPHWNYTVGAWAAKHPDVVEEFWTNQRHRMIRTIQTYVGAMQSGVLGHDDDPETGDLTRHIGNAGKQYTNLVDPQTGERLWILGKLHKDRKFDGAMAAVLSWQARMDVLPKLPKPKKRVFKQIR
ncbi:terminase [Mycobacterium sp. 1465703.0]|uniref:terminase n=1 Tax=Mycobacterium sp. 1465703.0 TaxID=1834078 RepID=UPI000800FBC4|nr:terminase [Mycobacterium sp. 1465703.0]OBI95553.1 terminase [Mycobacterium sp. 1465703.0]